MKKWLVNNCGKIIAVAVLIVFALALGGLFMGIAGFLLGK